MENQLLGLRTVIYRVADIAAAKAWYAENFNVKPYFDEPFYVGFNMAGYELGLQPEESAAIPKAENVLVYWGVSDVEKVYDLLLANGAAEHEAPQNVGGDIVVASVRDPWGNVIGIIYNPEFRLP